MLTIFPKWKNLKYELSDNNSIIKYNDNNNNNNTNNVVCMAFVIIVKQMEMISQLYICE